MATDTSIQHDSSVGNQNHGSPERGYNPMSPQENGHWETTARINVPVHPALPNDANAVAPGQHAELRISRAPIPERRAIYPYYSQNFKDCNYVYLFSSRALHYKTFLHGQNNAFSSCLYPKAEKNSLLEHHTNIFPSCLYPKQVKIKLNVRPVEKPAESIETGETVKRPTRNIRVSLMASSDSPDQINFKLLHDEHAASEPEPESIEMASALVPPRHEEAIQVNLLPVGDSQKAIAHKSCLTGSGVVMRTLGIGAHVGLEKAHQFAVYSFRVVNNGVHVYGPIVARAVVSSYKGLRRGCQIFLRKSAPIANHAKTATLGCAQEMRRHKIACMPCFSSPNYDEDELGYYEFQRPVPDRPSHYDKELAWRDTLRVYRQPNEESGADPDSEVDSSREEDVESRAAYQDRPTQELSVLQEHSYPPRKTESTSPHDDKRLGRLTARTYDNMSAIVPYKVAKSKSPHRKMLSPSPVGKKQRGHLGHQGLGALVWPPPDIRNFSNPLRIHELVTNLAVRPEPKNYRDLIQKPPLHDECIWRSTLRAYFIRNKADVRPEDVLLYRKDGRLRFLSKKELERNEEYRMMSDRFARFGLGARDYCYSESKPRDQSQSSHGNKAGHHYYTKGKPRSKVLPNRESRRIQRSLNPNSPKRSQVTPSYGRPPFCIPKICITSRKSSVDRNARTFRDKHWHRLPGSPFKRFDHPPPDPCPRGWGPFSIFAMFYRKSYPQPSEKPHARAGRPPTEVNHSVSKGRHSTKDSKQKGKLYYKRPRSRAPFKSYKQGFDSEGKPRLSPFMAGLSYLRFSRPLQKQSAKDEEIKHPPTPLSFWNLPLKGKFRFSIFKQRRPAPKSHSLGAPRRKNPDHANMGKTSQGKMRNQGYLHLKSQDPLNLPKRWPLFESIPRLKLFLSKKDPIGIQSLSQRSHRQPGIVPGKKWVDGRDKSPKKNVLTVNGEKKTKKNFKSPNIRKKNAPQPSSRSCLPFPYPYRKPVRGGSSSPKAKAKSQVTSSSPGNKSKLPNNLAAKPRSAVSRPLPIRPSLSKLSKKKVQFEHPVKPHYLYDPYIPSGDNLRSTRSSSPETTRRLQAIDIKKDVKKSSHLQRKHKRQTSPSPDSTRASRAKPDSGAQKRNKTDRTDAKPASNTDDTAKRVVLQPSKTLINKGNGDGDDSSSENNPYRRNPEIAKLMAAYRTALAKEDRKEVKNSHSSPRENEAGKGAGKKFRSKHNAAEQSSQEPSTFDEPKPSLSFQHIEQHTTESSMDFDVAFETSSAIPTHSESLREDEGSFEVHSVQNRDVDHTGEGEDASIALENHAKGRREVDHARQGDGAQENYQYSLSAELVARDREDETHFSPSVEMTSPPAELPFDESGQLTKDGESLQTLDQPNALNGQPDWSHMTEIRELGHDQDEISTSASQSFETDHQGSQKHGEFSQSIQEDHGEDHMEEEYARETAEHHLQQSRLDSADELDSLENHGTWETVESQQYQRPQVDDEENTAQMQDEINSSLSSSQMMPGDVDVEDESLPHEKDTGQIESTFGRDPVDNSSGIENELLVSFHDANRGQLKEESLEIESNQEKVGMQYPELEPYVPEDEQDDRQSSVSSGFQTSGSELHTTSRSAMIDDKFPELNFTDKLAAWETLARSHEPTDKQEGSFDDMITPVKDESEQDGFLPESSQIRGLDLDKLSREETSKQPIPDTEGAIASVQRIKETFELRREYVPEEESRLGFQTGDQSVTISEEDMSSPSSGEGDRIEDQEYNQGFPNSNRLERDPNSVTNEDIKPKSDMEKADNSLVQETFSPVIEGLPSEHVQSEILESSLESAPLSRGVQESTLEPQVDTFDNQENEKIGQAELERHLGSSSSRSPDLYEVDSEIPPSSSKTVLERISMIESTIQRKERREAGEVGLRVEQESSGDTKADDNIIGFEPERVLQETPEKPSVSFSEQSVSESYETPSEQGFDSINQPRSFEKLQSESASSSPSPSPSIGRNFAGPARSKGSVFVRPALKKSLIANETTVSELEQVRSELKSTFEPIPSSSRGPSSQGSSDVSSTSPTRSRKSIFTRPVLKKSLVQNADTTQMFAEVQAQSASIEGDSSNKQLNVIKEGEVRRSSRLQGLEQSSEGGDSGLGFRATTRKSLFVRPMLKQSLVASAETEQTFARLRSEQREIEPRADLRDDERESGYQSESSLGRSRSDSRSSSPNSSLDGSTTTAAASGKRKSLFTRPLLKKSLVADQQTEQLLSRLRIEQNEDTRSEGGMGDRSEEGLDGKEVGMRRSSSLEGLDRRISRAARPRASIFTRPFLKQSLVATSQTEQLFSQLQAEQKENTRSEDNLDTTETDTSNQKLDTTEDASFSTNFESNIGSKTPIDPQSPIRRISRGPRGSLFTRPLLKKSLLGTPETKTLFSQLQAEENEDTRSEEGLGDRSEGFDSNVDIRRSNSLQGLDRRVSKATRPRGSIFTRPFLKQSLVATPATEQLLSKLQAEQNEENRSEEKEKNIRPSIRFEGVTELETPTSSQGLDRRFSRADRQRGSFFTRPFLKRSLVANEETQQVFSRVQKEQDEDTRSERSLDTRSEEGFDTRQESSVRQSNSFTGLDRKMSSATRPRGSFFTRPILKKSLVATSDTNEVFSRLQAEQDEDDRSQEW